MNIIHVIAEITVKPGQRDEFISLFHRLVPTVLAEEGCIAYGPTVDVPAGIDFQPPDRPNIVTVIEQWEGVESLQKHLAAAHMIQFRDQVATLVDGLSIRVTEPV